MRPRSTVIDVDHCFIDDTKGYFDGMWDNPNEELRELGKSITYDIDPDIVSKVLLDYNYLMWNGRRLPDGRKMHLAHSDRPGALYWKEMDIHLSSDSITTSFMFKNIRKSIDTINEVSRRMNGRWHDYHDEYLRETYTFGGILMFPMRRNSINVRRATDAFVKDRFDRTLECIRMYYDSCEGKASDRKNPLEYVLKEDHSFFAWFGSFRNYVDFFFLNDCVDDDYNVISWLDGDAIPDADHYIEFIEKEKEFVRKRNSRIKGYLSESEKVRTHGY